MTIATITTIATMHHPIITGILIGLAVALTIACSLAVLLMRDVYQRLHFTTPPAVIGSGLIAIAVWIEDADPQSRIKATLIFVLMCMMNAALNHVTARAALIRQRGHWEPRAEDQLPLTGEAGRPTGRVVIVEEETIGVVRESESGAQRPANHDPESA